MLVHHTCRHAGFLNSCTDPLFNKVAQLGARKACLQNSKLTFNQRRGKTNKHRVNHRAMNTRSRVRFAENLSRRRSTSRDFSRDVLRQYTHSTRRSSPSCHIAHILWFCRPHSPHSTNGSGSRWLLIFSIKSAFDTVPLWKQRTKKRLTRIK